MEADADSLCLIRNIVSYKRGGCFLLDHLDHAMDGFVARQEDHSTTECPYFVTAPVNTSVINIDNEPASAINFTHSSGRQLANTNSLCVQTDQCF